MKYVLVVLAIVAASLSYSNTVLSDEYATGQPNEYGQIKSDELKSQKDECLIMAKNCVGGNETAMQRAERLKREIDKGAEVYTPEELKSFQDQLNFINSESESSSGGVY
jgi:hypothetical protein